MIKAVKEEIRNRKYAANAQMTLALKKGNIPLLDERNLFNAITYELSSSFNAEIGVFNSQSTGGVSSAPIGMQKLTELMHTGYTIKVTPKMRAAMMLAIMGKKTKSGRKLTKSAKAALSGMTKGSGVSVYRVPPRPFLSAIWKRPDIQKMIQNNWRQALEQAFLEAGAKGGDHKDK